MFLEILPEETLVGEVHFFCYFLDVLGRVLEQYTQLKGDVVVNPVVRRTSACQFYHFRKVFCRDAHIECIPSHAPLFTVIVLDEKEEIGEYLVGSCVSVFGYVHDAVDDIAQVVYHSAHHGDNSFASEAVCRFVDFE